MTKGEVAITVSQCMIYAYAYNLPPSRLTNAEMKTSQVTHSAVLMVGMAHVKCTNSQESIVLSTQTSEVADARDHV